MWPYNASKTNILTFIGVTLSFSWAAAIGLSGFPEAALGFGSILLVLPAMIAVTINIMYHKDFRYVFKGVFRGNTDKSSNFAFFYPIGFIAVLIVVASITGLGVFNKANIPRPADLIIVLISILLTMVIVFGEELGWRGFLLPALASKVGKLKATFIVATVWALYQMPSIFLIAKTLGAQQIWLQTLLQGGIVFMMSFPISYAYFLSKGSLVPALLFRAVWTNVMSLLISDTSATYPAMITGDLLLISGEGYLGLILGVIAMVWFIKEIPKLPDQVNDPKQV